MTTGEYAPLLRSGSSRTNGAQHHHEIQAHYFDITDTQSWPIAGLLVLLDGRGQPVRAELHLYDGLTEPVQDVALRQARLVLQERYTGGDPVPMRILETLQLREPLNVTLPPLGARPQVNRFEVNRSYIIGAAALMAMVLVIWLVTIFTQPETDEPAAADAPTPVETTVVAADGEAAPAEDAVVEIPGAIESDLPPSRNARPDLGIGLRVTIVPGLQAAVRTGANAGDIIGALGNGLEGTIIGGPALTQGDDDTIVWWFVELDDGIQGWSPANTSTQMLMIPVQE